MFQLDECITIPGPRLLSAFLCVRTFSLSGGNIRSCREIIQTNTGNYANNMVYDFDANADTWNEIKSVRLPCVVLFIVEYALSVFISAFIIGHIHCLMY